MRKKRVNNSFQPGFSTLFQSRAGRLRFGSRAPSEFANTRDRTCSRMCGKMSDPRPSVLARLRALCAALALLIAAVSPGIALATQTADMCGMVCCINEGRCCCNPGRSLVQGQTKSGLPSLSSAAVAAPCPEGCATPASSTVFRLRHLAQPPAHHAILADPTVARWHNVIAAVQLRDLESSSPRGPPRSLPSA